MTRLKMVKTDDRPLPDEFSTDKLATELYKLKLEKSLKPSGPAAIFASIKEGIENFPDQLDKFVDDAANKRLGNGHIYYGKRKSDFYGTEDPGRKSDPNEYNREEDYVGPNGGSYFLLSKERDDKGRPMGFLTKK